VACIQGIVTNDVEKPGDGSLTYAAVLTPKGMIRTDLWIWRVAERVRLVAPREARDGLTEVLQRTLPPRLARFQDRTDSATVFCLVGPGAPAAATRAGFPVPEAGRVSRLGDGEPSILVACPSGPGPFMAAICADHDGPDVAGALQRHGALPVRPEVLDLARIMAGWPRLGAEMDDKTLPQEVRFDEIGGVSYSKGCYTGQETVARLHFRGHANRGLMGLTWDGQPDQARSEVSQEGKALGVVTSLAWLSTRQQWIGLAKVRRELDRARAVEAAGAAALPTALPFSA
jgi:folate-binding protein YgfZ